MGGELESRWSKKSDEIVFIWPIDHPHDPAGHTVPAGPVHNVCD